MSDRPPTTKFIDALLSLRLWLILLALISSSSILMPGFLQPYIVYNLLLVAAPLSIAAIAQTFCLISKNIDLSIGNLALLTGYVVAWLSAEDPAYASGLNIDPLLAICIALLIALFLGFINGILVAKIGIHPFLATLATSLIFRSAAYMMAEGHTIYGLPEWFFTKIGMGNILGFLPYSFILMIGLYTVFNIILKRTTFGWHVYAIGGKRYAAFVTGINVKNSIICVYIISGLLSGLCGILLTAKAMAATITTAVNYEVYSIGIAIMGGVSLSGGVGELLNVLAASIIFAAIEIILSFSGISVFWIRVVQGVIILIVVIIDYILNLIKQRGGV